MYIPCRCWYYQGQHQFHPRRRKDSVCSCGLQREGQELQLSFLLPISWTWAGTVFRVLHNCSWYLRGMVLPDFQGQGMLGQRHCWSVTCICCPLFGLRLRSRHWIHSISASSPSQSRFSQSWNLLSMSSALHLLLSVVPSRRRVCNWQD